MDATEIEAANEAPPYQEARGPHLPGPLEGLPWLAWVFIVLALGDLVWFVVTATSASAASLVDLGSYALRAVPSVSDRPAARRSCSRATPMRPRARPACCSGPILYALVQGLLILGQPLQGLFETITPASEELPGLVPLAAIYDGLIGLVGAVRVALHRRRPGRCPVGTRTAPRR